MVVRSVNGYIYAISVTIAARLIFIYVSVYANRYLAIQNKHKRFIGFKGLGIIVRQDKHRTSFVIGFSALILTLLQERCIFSPLKKQVENNGYSVRHY